MRRRAIVLVILTFLSGAVTMACLGLALVPSDGDFLPLAISGAVTCVLAGLTLAVVRRLPD